MSLSEILACPVCHAALKGERCRNCGREYRRIDGVLDLTPVPPPDAEVRRRWGLWEELQENGERAYEFDPPSSLAVGDRADTRAFARFSDLRGRVLDVGCGPQAVPSYATGFEGEFVGIDPLLGAQPREFEFVKGVGEYLPFLDQSFDRVLFVTSIDHLLSPAISLRSAARVTRPGGIVSVWLGEVAPSPTRADHLADFSRSVTRARLRASISALRSALRRKPKIVDVETHSGVLQLDVPRGATDPFHFEHPTREKVLGWLAAAGLAVEEIDDAAVPSSCFIRARRPPAEPA
jgi:SAM-dependent methyltransferase